MLYFLALFTLLTISSITFFAAKRLKIPYTVLLVAVGLALVPLAHTAAFSFLTQFTLTPDLLFYVFLPILIFESAYNINIRKVEENTWSISFLAVLSLLISAIFASAALYGAFLLLGIPLPFIVLLLFGALISATDPVAVLALFKEYGAPRRLSLIFEGESLFNDGTAMALFLVVLSVALTGYHGLGSAGAGVLMFLSMVIGGTLFGLFMGALFSQLLGATRSNENVSIMLMMVLAHTTFILSELISEHLVIGGFPIQLSAIIATTVASMFIGNYGRYKISPRAEEFVEKFWAQFAFIANSLVFILIGLLFSTLPFNIWAFLLPIAVTVAIVAAGRALSVYPVVGFLNWLGREERIPRSWQHLLAWGSLRGALAITLVLLIPDAWTPAHWTYAFTPKELILALTIGCIYATLFVKATTIGSIIRRLGIDSLTRTEEVEHQEAMELMYARMLERLDDFHAKGYLDQNSHRLLKQQYSDALECAHEESHAEGDRIVATQVLRMYAIGIEKHFLSELYTYGEISELPMRRLMTKLSWQLSQLERGNSGFDPHTSGIEKRDWFERLASFVRNVVPRAAKEADEEQYMYYRAKAIITRKVIKELRHMGDTSVVHFFDAESLQGVIDLYQKFRSDALERMHAIAHEHPAAIEPLNKTLASRGLAKVQESVLDELAERDMITAKLHIALAERFEAEHYSA